MEHALYMAIITLPLIFVLWIERKSLKTYVKLGVFTIILAAIWEPIGVYTNLWIYHSHGQFLGVSVLTLLLYFHWVSFSYFIGNRTARRLAR